MKRISIFLSTQELTPFYNVFDLNRDGKIHFGEFVQALRVAWYNQNAMSDERIATVKKAFHKLDKSGKGLLQVDELIASYNAELHPRVRTREKTVSQVQTEFERAIRNKSRDGSTISEMDFLDYYADVSACLPAEREDHFNNVEPCQPDNTQYLGTEGLSWVYDFF
jgi:Ca2+-binding EF-hand superfamily protein